MHLFTHVLIQQTFIQHLPYVRHSLMLRGDIPQDQRSSVCGLHFTEGGWGHSLVAQHLPGEHEVKFNPWYQKYILLKVDTQKKIITHVV